ncbi:MAG TPA: EamA family transporter [Candidatus Kapabacteria bacterium]|nr:EamA family transporter [Candidatus Kapabacteria bacterium]
MFEILLVLQQLIASLSHIIAKDITKDVSPNLVLLLRASIAAFVYTIWIVYSKKYKIKIDKKDYYKLIILGIINIPINQFLFFIAISKTTAPNVSLAYALTPIFVFIIAFFYLGEKLSTKRILGIIIAVLGTIVLLSEKGLKFNTDGLIGDTLALVASLSWAFYTIIGKQLIQKYNPIYITGLTMIIGLITYLPFLPFSNIDYSLIIHLDTLDYLQLLYLGTFTSAIGYAIWYYALTKIDASKLSVFNNLQPALTATLSFFIFGTPITLLFVVGAAMILLGVYVTQRG